MRRRKNNGSCASLKAVSGVGSPIVVEGRPWGAITLASRESLPRDAEQRLEKFTELVATAVANAASRQALHRLADEQAALRRVATLVAEGAPPATVFDAVAAEMLGLLQADGLSVCRYEDDGELTIVAHRGARRAAAAAGAADRHDDPDSITATVRRTGQPARIDTYGRPQGRMGELIDRLQVQIRRRRPDRRRRAGVGRHRVELGKRGPAGVRHRAAHGAVRWAARHRDRQRGQPGPAHRVTSAPAHGGRRRTTASGA